MDLFGLLFADLGDAVEDESRRDAVGDAVADGHKDAGKVGRNRLVEVVPLDLPEGGHHHDADHNQRRSGGRKRDGADKGCQKGADGKAERNNHAGQTGAAARADACGALDVGGGVGGAKDRADRGGNRVGEQRPVHLGVEAGGGLHRALVLLAEDAGAASGADEGADGVKGVGEAEREDGDQHQRQLGDIREQRRQALAGEDGAEGGRQLAAGLGEADRLGGDGDAHRDAKQCGGHDADEDGALDLADQQDDGQGKADQKQPEGRLIEGGQRRHAGIKADDADIEKADVGHKDADTAADGVLQAARNGLDDVFTDFGDGDDDVQHAADEHHRQRLLPGKAQGCTNGVDKKGVESHAGRQRVGDVGHQAHNQGTDNRGDDGRQKDRAPLHAGLA